MKITFIITIFLLAICQNVTQAQTHNDSIEIKKNRSFSQNGQRLTYSELQRIVSLNPETQNYRDKATINNVAASILSLTGGVFVLFPIGVLIAYDKLYIVPVLLGGGMLVASVPFAMATKENMIKAVHIYNSGLTKSNISKTKLKFGLTSSGVGLTLKF